MVKKEFDLTTGLILNQLLLMGAATSIFFRGMAIFIWYMVDAKKRFRKQEVIVL